MIFSDKFQQLFEFFVSQVQLVPRQNGGYSCCAAETGTHSVLLGPGAVLGPGRCARVAQRQGCGQTVQQAVLVMQLQFLEFRRLSFVPHGKSPWSCLFRKP